ncbi:putative hemerythrin-like protein [Beauveria bassiana]|nr:putative hemerythrin-like protein [Beauveria bassiana]
MNLLQNAGRSSTLKLLHNTSIQNITKRFQTAAMSTISSAIVKDHRELKEYYDEVINNPNNHDHQQRYGNQFTWELARHSVGEELVVYPALEKYLGDRGKKMADEDREEHHQVKEMLKVFQNMSSSDKEYIPQLKKIWSTLDEHIKEEEERDLPALEEKLQQAHGESNSMATSFGRTKAFVPSRSHPSAGEKPPFETVMGLLTAPIDHIADIFRKFPDQTISPNPSTK